MLEILNTTNDIVPALFAYLFNRIDQRQFINYVAKTSGCRKEGTRLKNIARTNGYLLKNCKLYAYACHVARKTGVKPPRASYYGVTTTDAKLLKRLNLSHLQDFRAFSLKDFDATVHRVVSGPDLKAYIGKFVTKKMSFILKSYGETRLDINAHLVEMAIRAIYMQYPRFETELHMLNVAKAQIHNKGQTFITSVTAQRRQRLITNAEGLPEAVHVDIETAQELHAPIEYGLEIRERLQALSKLEGKMTDRSKQFLMCAAGQHHEGFSEFLAIDNSEFADQVEYDLYLAHLRSYFGVSAENMESLFLKLRNTMHRNLPG